MYEERGKKRVGKKIDIDGEIIDRDIAEMRQRDGGWDPGILNYYVVFFYEVHCYPGPVAQ